MFSYFLLLLILMCMVGKYLRKVFAAFTALFWADKSRLLLGVFASFWAVQHIACAYGSDEPICEDDCYDPAWDCTPVFDVNRISREGYTECENKIADLVLYMEDCENPYDGEPVVETSGSGIMDNAYVDGKLTDCSYYTQKSAMNSIDSYTQTCFTDHMEFEYAFVGYQCGTEYVSVEEGNQRKSKKVQWTWRHTR